MAYQEIACPHCRVTENLESLAATGRAHWGHFLFKCDSCPGPIVITAEARKPKQDYKYDYQVQRADCSFEDCGWQITKICPEPEFDRGFAPACAPEEVAAMMEHAHEAAERGGHELAMLGYQRALKLIQRIQSPDFKGNPNAWVSTLIEDNALTGAMKKWARRVKICGAIDGATALECEDLASFVCTLIDQLFALGPRMAKFGRCAA